MTAPVPTLTAGGEHVALIEPMFIDQSHPADENDAARCKAGPLGTITTSNNWSTISPLFIPQHGGGTVKPVGEPLSTIATTGSIGIVHPFLASYYGNGNATPAGAPVPTITTKDRFALICGRVLQLSDGRRYKLDIAHRMLTAEELAAATGFPPGYRFAGDKKEIKKQIGNAVCPALASALYRAFLAA